MVQLKQLIIIVINPILGRLSRLSVKTSPIFRLMTKLPPALTLFDTLANVAESSRLTPDFSHTGSFCQSG